MSVHGGSMLSRGRPAGLYQRLNGREHRLTSLLFTLPFALLFITFTLLPILSSVVLSFTYFNMLERPLFIGLDNYVRLLLEDDVFLIALRNTFVFALITGPLSYLLSFVFAWFITDFRRGLRTALTFLFYAPSLAGNVYFVWTYIFSDDSFGLLNATLLRLGAIRDSIQWLSDPKYSMGVVIVVILWLSMSVGFLSFVAGLQSMDKSLYEAGAVDGVKNRFQELWYITLPQMVPQLLFGAVMQISASFAVGYEAMSLTGFPSTDYATHTIILHILDYGSIRYEMGYASAIAVVLFFLMLLFWSLVKGGLRRFGEEDA